MLTRLEFSLVSPQLEKTQSLGKTFSHFDWCLQLSSRPDCGLDQVLQKKIQKAISICICRYSHNPRAANRIIREFDNQII